jgi:hypothetical protein
MTAPEIGRLIPGPGEIWQHHKGGKYQIVSIAAFEDSLRLAVVYRSLDNGITWVRLAQNFMEYVNDSTPRFTKLSAAEDR